MKAQSWWVALFVVSSIAGVSACGSSQGGAGGAGGDSSPQANGGGGGGQGGSVSDWCSETDLVSGITTCEQIKTPTSDACVAGTKRGACGTSSLVGCCIYLPASGATHTEKIDCFYDDATATQAKGDCSGTGQRWSKTLP
jgi:hypothetical protein